MNDNELPPPAAASSRVGPQVWLQPELHRQLQLQLEFEFELNFELELVFFFPGLTIDTVTDTSTHTRAYRDTDVLRCRLLRGNGTNLKRCKYSQLYPTTIILQGNKACFLYSQLWPATNFTQGISTTYVFILL